MIFGCGEALTLGGGELAPVIVRELQKRGTGEFTLLVGARPAAAPCRSRRENP